MNATMMRELLDEIRDVARQGEIEGIDVPATWLLDKITALLDAGPGPFSYRSIEGRVDRIERIVDEDDVEVLP